MVNVLPIKFIAETDRPIYGSNLFNLARLQRCDFPVLPGIVVTAPQILLSTILEHFKEAGKEIFQQRLEFVKKEISKIPCPEELVKSLGKEKSFCVSGKIYDSKVKLWQALMQIWLEEISKKLWQEGFGEGVTANLTAAPVFFISKKFLQFSAHFDPDLKDVVISGQTLDLKISEKIKELVISANKKLFLPQVYQLVIINNLVQIVGISPFTQSLQASKVQEIVMPKVEQKQTVKSVVKVFFNLSRGFSVPGNIIDGVLIEGEKIEDFDSAIFKLAEAALSNPSKPVIFKLPDISDDDIRGTLRLIHQKSLLDMATEIFLFARNKKNLQNVELGIPLVRSPEELEQIKRELMIRGISRKGTSEFWLEMAVPENIINLDDYLAVGIDGIILNLDELQKHLGGYGVEECEFYRNQISALIKFIKPVFKNAKLPVLVRGQLALYPEVLDFLIENGVWGVVANTEIEAESLPEHLNWSERRMVAKRLV